VKWFNKKNIDYSDRIPWLESHTLEVSDTNFTQENSQNLEEQPIQQPLVEEHSSEFKQTLEEMENDLIYQQKQLEIRKNQRLMNQEQEEKTSIPPQVHSENFTYTKENENQFNSYQEEQIRINRIHNLEEEKNDYLLGFPTELENWHDHVYQSNVPEYTKEENNQEHSTCNEEPIIKNELNSSTENISENTYFKTIHNIRYIYNEPYVIDNSTLSNQTNASTPIDSPSSAETINQKQENDEIIKENNELQNNSLNEKKYNLEYIHLDTKEDINFTIPEKDLKRALKPFQSDETEMLYPNITSASLSNRTSTKTNSVQANISNQKNQQENNTNKDKAIETYNQSSNKFTPITEIHPPENEKKTSKINLSDIEEVTHIEEVSLPEEEVFLPEEKESVIREETSITEKVLSVEEDTSTPEEEVSTQRSTLSLNNNLHPQQEDDSIRASITPIVNVNSKYKIKKDFFQKSNDQDDLIDPKETQHIISTLEKTLEQFHIRARVVGIQKGPIITRYELKIPMGIKVSKIAGLSDELAMSLEAMRVRIEAPIPGRNTIGIEIPNKKRKKVLLGDILNSNVFKEFEGNLPLPLGKDIAGNIIIEELSKMPHLLIAGATGSGKSVSINSYITTLITNKSPIDLRLLLIDPKLVELSHYNDIPHLLHPVITDASKAVQALTWLVEEMERRYEDMADKRVRDINSYNEKIAKLNQNEVRSQNPHPKMPFIILLIDELGDLMMVAGKEIESSIIRISQKARAVGIHLILATQRPSVDVITALIKANCPARIALQVSQKTDSRTILDSNGAEQLLGRGDSLFKHPSIGKLNRIQSPLVEDNEVEAAVNAAKKLGKPEYIKLEDPESNASVLDNGDEVLFDDAWEIILEAQKASASYLQRRLRIGYNRAARLIEAFEARGYIGPQIGSKPREIIVGKQ